MRPLDQLGISEEDWKRTPDSVRSALMTLLFKLDRAQQGRPLLKINFSLDSKADREFGHVSIQYYLTEKGQASDDRDVYSWAGQASRNRELSKDIVAKIIDIVRGLPNPEEEQIPKEWLVTLTFHDGDDVVTREYHRKRLPHALKEILDLLGGIRDELRDTVGFSAPCV
jgi:hypothetical protein